MEAHFKLHLSHPLQTRAPRGRKRDFRDARRLVDRLSQVCVRSDLRYLRSPACRPVTAGVSATGGASSNRLLMTSCAAPLPYHITGQPAFRARPRALQNLIPGQPPPNVRSSGCCPCPRRTIAIRPRRRPAPLPVRDATMQMLDCKGLPNGSARDCINLLCPYAR
jgi:hypothetical protein